VTQPVNSNPAPRHGQSRLLSLVLASALLSVAFWLVLSRAQATSTQSFLLDDAASLSAGELDGAAVYSTGYVAAGLEARRIELPDAVVAFCMARLADGTTYIGTGDEGRIYRLRGDELSVFAETHQLLVSSLAVAPNGTLYAGTIPEGRVYAITPGGDIHELAQLEGAQHVWALAYDARRNLLFAGTGPEGRIVSIDAAGYAQTYYDSRAGHILSLALDTDGALYAGTSDDALVLRLRGPGHAEVVHDFPGNEITAIDVRTGQLAVVANDMPTPVVALTTTSSSSTTHATTPTRRTGKGSLFLVDAQGRTERIYHDDGAHFTAVELAEDGSVRLGVGKDGRVLSVNSDGSWATLLDLDERQVLALSLGGDDPVVLTGDSGAVYRVRRGAPERGLWTSKVLDAQFQARFGQVHWRGEGTLEVLTRTGNTEEPDDTWSDWSTPVTSPGPVHSPAARFVQIRARFTRDPNAVLRAMELFYLPRNQRAVITSVAAGRQHGPSKVAQADPPPSSRYDLSWNVRNPDEDSLRYRMRFRQESQTRFRDILREDEVLTADHYAWETESLPDGWYVIQVSLSDELSNDADDALSAQAQSEPFRVDNHAPTIPELGVRAGTLTARVVDSLGPVAGLELAIDGQAFRPLLPADGLLDQAEERVSIELAPRLRELPAGDHILALKARDAAGNSVVREIVVTWPPRGQQP